MPTGLERQDDDYGCGSASRFVVLKAVGGVSPGWATRFSSDIRTGLGIDHFGRLHPGIAEAAGMLGPNAIPTLEWSASRGGGPESPDQGGGRDGLLREVTLRERQRTVTLHSQHKTGAYV
jgi:hypothetical protein